LIHHGFQPNKNFTLVIVFAPDTNRLQLLEASQAPLNEFEEGANLFGLEEFCGIQDHKMSDICPVETFIGA